MSCSISAVLLSAVLETASVFCGLRMSKRAVDDHEKYASRRLRLPRSCPMPPPVSTVSLRCSYGLEGEAREAQIKKLLSKLDYVITHQLAGGKKFLVGDSFTIADSYFAVVLSWAPYVSVDLPAALVEYRDNIFGLDFVKEARAAVAAASPK